MVSGPASAFEEEEEEEEDDDEIAVLQISIADSGGLL